MSSSTSNVVPIKDIFTRLLRDLTNTTRPQVVPNVIRNRESKGPNAERSRNQEGTNCVTPTPKSQKPFLIPSSLTSSVNFNKENLAWSSSSCMLNTPSMSTRTGTACFRKRLFRDITNSPDLVERRQRQRVLQTPESHLPKESVNPHIQKSRISSYTPLEDLGQQVYECGSEDESDNDADADDTEDDVEISDKVWENAEFLSRLEQRVIATFGTVPQTNEPVIEDDGLDKRRAEWPRIFNENTKKNKTEYIDHGDPIYTCEHCGAIMWYGERINKQKTTTKPIFSLCCLQGQVKLPILKDSPELLYALLTNNDPISRHFRENIRAYNMIFSFTSLGGNTENSVLLGHGPQMFQIQGENYHLLGSLQPEEGEPPKFMQMYICDTENEVENRANSMSNGKNAGKYQKDPNLRNDVIDAIIKMLNKVNPYVEKFRMARDRLKMDEEGTFHMRIVSTREKDGRVYDRPTASEVAALIPGDFQIEMPTRDIVVEAKSGTLKRISEVHPSYLALQYPLLFPYGEDGFRPGILKTFTGVKKKNPFISIRQWFAYRIMERRNERNILLRTKRLFQQFLVDSYTAIESNRLGYIKLNQTSLRADNYNAVKNAEGKGKKDMNDQGKACYLPKTFTGGPRYMRNLYLDAMSICKYFGFPDLFITFTCNPTWPEIYRFCKERNLNSDDRPEVICRMYKMKLDSLMDDLTKKSLLGKTVSSMYTIEFQKRGLPHAHILIWMHPVSKIKTAEDVDKMICAEIPDKAKDPELYEVVKEMMIHGPCGAVNPNSPCMVNGKCSKFYPKSFVKETRTDKEGVTAYRRRNNKVTVEKKKFECDNRYVIPYNRLLSLRYRAHINMEYCNQNNSVKYIFKYVTKGEDRVSVVVEPKKKKVVTDTVVQEKEKEKIDTNVDGQSDQRNEVKDFFDCRYVSACESAWRELKYSIHHRSTPVLKLSFHLPGEQLLYFKADDVVETVLNRKDVENSMFLAWFKLNQVSSVARGLTYAEIPNRFTYEPKTKQFKLRQKGFAIGRINYVPRQCEDGYYMRVLLNVQKGPRSFEELRTVDEIEYASWKGACFALGLLDDDQEYIDDLRRMNNWASGGVLRQAFMYMLECTLSQPEKVWEACWDILSQDIEFMKRDQYNRPDLILSDEDKRRFALEELQKLLRSNGTSLSSYPTMPQPESNSDDEINVLVFDERNYDRDRLTKNHTGWVNSLTSEQRHIYDEIMGAVLNDRGGVFFLYGFGGTGKTFLWKTLSAAIRSKGDIVLNVASSGIASLLLEGGRTAHSRFGIPINPDEFTTCSMKPGSDRADLVKQASLIIWDEAPMMSKHCFESLDRSLSDIVGSADGKPFGGKVVVFGGDFRQVLPVIEGASRTEIVMAAINSSYLWKHCKVFTLTKNMRLNSKKLSSIEAKDIKDFSEWILKVGDGKIAEPNDGEALIEIPDEFLITDAQHPIEAIVKEIYGDPSLLHTEEDPIFFQERAILCPTNEDVDQINDHMLGCLVGEERVYLSSDSIDPSDISSTNNPVLTPDFLNSIKVPGLPNHKLRLKIGCPVMLLRNIDPKRGLMNGTRLQITQMGELYIEARVITGDRVGDLICLPRLLITPSETKLPFRMRRRQLPLSLAFAITINKSQGQSLEKVGLFLPRPCFSHGQLYVAISRVTSKKGLKILIVDKDGKPQKKTMNVVFKEVFKNLR